MCELTWNELSYHFNVLSFRYYLMLWYTGFVTKLFLVYTLINNFSDFTKKKYKIDWVIWIDINNGHFDQLISHIRNTCIKAFVILPISILILLFKLFSGWCSIPKGPLVSVWCFHGVLPLGISALTNVWVNWNCAKI